MKQLRAFLETSDYADFKTDPKFANYSSFAEVMTDFRIAVFWKYLLLLSQNCHRVFGVFTS